MQSLQSLMAESRVSKDLFRNINRNDLPARPEIAAVSASYRFLVDGHDTYPVVTSTFHIEWYCKLTVCALQPASETQHQRDGARVYLARLT